MANPPAAPGYGKRSSSKDRKRGSGKRIARKQPAAKPAAKPGASSGNRITGKQPATKPGSDPRPREIAAGTRNHPTDRARVLVSCARVLVES